MNGTVVGIDVGSLGLRVAWSGPDCRPVEVDVVPAVDQPWVTAELGADSVVFVTVRQQRSPAAVRKLVTEFAAARERVGAEAGQEADRVVLTVPVRMESRNRIALRDAARAAGFTDVHLINDAVAAVLSEDGSGPARTVLVYSLGYSGFEIGLLRVARGQVRVLHHTAADEPSGGGMDRWVINAWLDRLRELDGLGERNIAGLNGWSAAEWTRLRAAADEAKRQLAENKPFRGGWPPWSTESASALVTPPPEDFHREADVQVATTRDRVREALADAGLAAEDVDTVLLVGGYTALPAVPAMLGDELGGLPHRIGPNHLARGAAVYGARLRPADAALVDREAEFTDVPERPLTPIGLSPPAQATPPSRAQSADPIADARRLWQDGKPDDAKAALTTLIDHARRLLNEIDQTPAAAVGGEPEDLFVDSTPEARERAQRAINRADSALKKGRLAQAVSESHQAWSLAPDLDDVFRQMIQVHLGAARAADTPDRFDDAQRWLRCAQMHASSSKKEIIDCLVDRTLAQARHHHGQGRHTEAMSLLAECMDLDPYHRGVQELCAEIDAQPPG